MSVARALSKLFPGIVIGEAGASECSIERLPDGRHVITTWTRPERQPTQAEIDAADVLAAADEQQAALDKATLENIEQQAKLALTRLAEIQADSSMTNARAVQAVRELALIVERLVRLETRQAR